MITRADNDQTLLIIHTHHYDENVLEFITENQIQEQAQDPPNTTLKTQWINAQPFQIRNTYTPVK